MLGNDAYGGTFRLIAKVWGPHGMAWSTADLTDTDALAAAWPDGTSMVWLETPTNPLLTCIDIQTVSDIAHAKGALVVVDNTFATPYLQQPLTLGADVVVHSTTKYLGGHSDVVGGFVAVDDDDLADRLRFTQNAAGAVPGPFDCFLVLRGVKTLGVRMERHCSNARAVVDLLVRHPAVERVLYPQLPDHPGHAAAARQMRDFGGMVSFTVRGGAEAAKRVAGATELFTLAESLGAVESLIEHPGEMTHASVAGSPLEVPDDLLRLSVGIESSADLVADLEQALDGHEARDHWPEDTAELPVVEAPRGPLRPSPDARSSSPPTACRSPARRTAGSRARAGWCGPCSHCCDRAAGRGSAGPARPTTFPSRSPSTASTCTPCW